MKVQIVIPLFDMKKKGFTLIEIMVVIVIILLMTTVIIIAIDISRKKTRDAVIVSSLEQIMALGDTVYNPAKGYKDLYGHSDINQLRKKINELGDNQDITLYFPYSKGGAFKTNEDFSSFCAYTKLFRNPEQYFCVDSLGNRRFVGGNGIDGSTLINCSDLSAPSPVDCNDR